MSKKFSIKPQVEQLDIETDEGPVFVRQLTSGDKIRLGELQGKMAEIASKVRAESGEDELDAETLGQKAAKVLTSDQYASLLSLQAEVVFLRWCTEDGKRRFSDRADFDEVPAKLIDAIYLECSEVDPDVEDAEGNSESPPD